MVSFINTGVPYLSRRIFFKLLLVTCFVLGCGQSVLAVNVSLTWDANSEESLAGYRVFHRKIGQSYSYKTPAWQGSSTSCTMTGLDDNTPFYFVVRAYDNIGTESADSAEVVSQGLLLSSLNITGSNSLNEGRSGNYTATAIYSDGSAQIVTEHTIWSATTTYATIGSNGVLAVSSVTSNVTVVISATFSESGVTKTAQKTITINDTTPTLSSVAIIGANTINEETTNIFTATATYSDGGTQTVTTSVSWSENTSYASLTNKGVLTTTAVPSDQSITIMANFSEGGTTKTAQKTITIKDSTPSLSSMSITGSVLVNENLNAGYTALATFSDGSTQTVTSSASWSENSINASITHNGVLNASEVTADETVVITAVYTYNAVTKTAQKTITVVDVPLENVAPVKPNITTPYDGQDNCDLVFNIMTESFFDPDGDVHTNSCWQISKKNDFLDPVLDVTSNKHLTSITVPHTLLEENITYFLRVRFYDIYMASSDWSNTVTFTTALDIADGDHDGVPDDQQVSVGVDLDSNGVDDIDEPETIKSVQSQDGVTRLGVYKDSETITSIDAVELIDPSTLPVCANKPDVLPHRIFSYRVSVNSPGAIAHVTVYFDEPIADGLRFYKYDTINGWSDYSEHATFNGDGRSITLEVQDGGYGDCDGKANGTIVDPGALGTSESSTNSNVSSGSSTGGCFIATINSDKSGKTGNTFPSVILVSLIIIAIMGCRMLINRNKIPL